MRAAWAFGAVLAALALGACAPLGVSVPGAGVTGTSTSASGVSSQVATANRTHEYPSPAPPAERAPGAASPQAAILAFATAYINWSAATVTADLGRLARASVGQARAELQLAAAQTSRDYELHRSGIANHGTVEAIAPLRGQPGRYVVVTRESTTAAVSTAYQGLAPAWHITVAAARQQAGAGWVLSGWQPEG
jgi:hypothetical protein